MSADVALLRTWLNSLTPAPLDPGDPRYVPLEEAGRAAVDSIFSLIDLRLETTTQLLSGPNGSGKTTELRRLKRDLQEVGFTVVLVDIRQYVSQSAEIDATEFLIALGLAFGEHLIAGPDEQGRGFAARLRAFLERVKVSIDIGPGRATASAAGVQVAVPGLSLDIDLKREIRSSEPFVQELRTKLAFQLGELYREVAGFCQELVAEDRVRNPASRGVVLIVDSLEKLREMASVQKLFLRDSEKLRFASHHVVYTVPPYLLFTDPGQLPFDGTVRPVPVPHVIDPGGAAVEKNVAQLADVVARRVDWQHLLGDEAALRTAILASGGHLSDLFLILQEVITAAHGRGADLPVGSAAVDRAVTVVARSFAGITEENAACLRAVAKQHGRLRPADHEIDRLARLLDNHMLLAHLNGDSWYEVHPLARRVLGLG